MFKRIFITCFLSIFLMTGIALAQPVETVSEESVVMEEPVETNEEVIINLRTPIEYLPPLKQGVIYSLDDQEFKYASTTDIIEKWGLTLEAGYAVPDTIIGVISYRLGNLGQFGINVPVLDFIDVNVGYYVGWKDLNDSEESKFDHGISFTLLNLKF